MRKIALPKTDVRYWRDRVFKPVSVRSSGERLAGGCYAVKLQSGGKRMALSLHTANREEAAQLARRMHQDLVVMGWDKFLAQYRPQPTLLEPTRKELLTVGEYIGLVRAKDLLPPKTIGGYAMRFRGMVSEIAGILATKVRYRAGSTAHQAWLDKIDGIPLASITPELVRQWKKDRIAKAKNPLERKHILASVNSTMRQARGLFSERKVLRFIEIARPHPFEGVEFDPKTDSRFFGTGISAPELLRRGLRELAVEELKAFLGLALGLRRLEADHLEWDSFDFDRSTVQITATQYYGLKSEKSAAVLSLDREIMTLFRGWHAQRRGSFVLESDKPPRPQTHSPYYRADATFNRLILWLQRQGINGTKPLHALRKMYGSLIVEKHGLFVASATLRHSSISTTTSHYLDYAVAATSGLGSVLSGADVLSFPLHSTRQQASG